MTDQVEFIVYGRPAPQGSKQAFAIYKGKKGAKVFTGKVAQVEMSKYVKPWRAEVAKAAREVGLAEVMDGPLLVDMVFTAVRPKSHYRTGRFAHLLKSSAPPAPISPPDLSKLSRATEDALKGIIWRDDSLVVSYGRLLKVFSDSGDPDALKESGAVIRVRPFVPAPAVPLLPGMGGRA